MTEQLYRCEEREGECFCAENPWVWDSKRRPSGWRRTCYLKTADAGYTCLDCNALLAVGVARRYVPADPADRFARLLKQGRHVLVDHVAAGETVAEAGEEVLAWVTDWHACAGDVEALAELATDTLIAAGDEWGDKVDEWLANLDEAKAIEAAQQEG